MPPVADRARLPEHWPTNRGSSAFREQLGRTVATFSHLEDMMARAWFGLTTTCGFEDIEQAQAAFPRWGKALREPVTDSLHSLTKKLKKAFKDDDRVPDEVSGAFLARLDEVRVWRNALCHGAWQGFREDGSVGLRYFRRGDEGPEQLENRLSIEIPSSIRAATVDLTADLADILSAAGVRFPGTALPGAADTDNMSNDWDWRRFPRLATKPPDPATPARARQQTFASSPAPSGHPFAPEPCIGMSSTPAQTAALVGFWIASHVHHHHPPSAQLSELFPIGLSHFRFSFSVQIQPCQVFLGGFPRTGPIEPPLRLTIQVLDGGCVPSTCQLQPAQCAVA